MCVECYRRDGEYEFGAADSTPTFIESPVLHRMEQYRDGVVAEEYEQMLQMAAGA